MPELKLETIRRFLSHPRHHHACVVDQQVEPIEAVGKRADELIHRAEVRKVEQHELDGRAGRRFEDGADSLVAPLLAAAGKDDGCTFQRERFRCLESDSAIGPRDDCHAPGLIGNVCGVPPFLGHGSLAMIQ